MVYIEMQLKFPALFEGLAYLITLCNAGQSFLMLIKVYKSSVVIFNAYYVIYYSYMY